MFTKKAERFDINPNVPFLKEDRFISSWNDNKKWELNVLSFVTKKKKQALQSQFLVTAKGW